jgi:STE24 endopeptidase
MEPKTIFLVIVAIIIFDYFLERILDFLNIKRIKSDLPPELEGIYNEEKYRKSQQYKKENDKLSLISSTISLIAILLMLFLGGFAWVNEIAKSITTHYILMPLVFFGVLMLASSIISLPFSIYDTFVIEEKYGFNKTTPKTFILDRIKGMLLSIVIGGGLFALILWFYQVTASMFWIYAWVLLTVFMVFMNMFYSTLIVPLFNKQTPLPEGELREAIEDFSEKVGFKLDNIFVIDGSKRSSKANAYFAGFGRRKRIVLFDTLIEDMEKNELVSVLAHEIGHYKKKHTIAGMFLSVLQTGLTLYILSLFISVPELSLALGVDEASFHIGLIAFGILYSPISMLLGLGLNVFSRKNEYQADKFAAVHYKPQALIEALKKLSSKNLSNLTPHPAYVFFHYSHPPLLQRVRALKKIKEDESGNNHHR